MLPVCLPDAFSYGSGKLEPSFTTNFRYMFMLQCMTTHLQFPLSWLPSISRASNTHAHTLVSSPVHKGLAPRNTNTWL